MIRRRFPLGLVGVTLGLQALSFMRPSDALAQQPPAAPPEPPAAPPAPPAAEQPPAPPSPNPPAPSEPPAAEPSPPGEQPQAPAAPPAGAPQPAPEAPAAQAPSEPAPPPNPAEPNAEGAPPVTGEGETASSEALAEEQDELGVITVTAQRRETTLQKTPIALTAFSQEEIKVKQISDFRDLSGRIPGLTAPLRSTAYTTQTYSVRGIGEIDTYPEPSVAVYIDDVYLARTVGSMYDTPDLERVEVLRGPQGTLYGRNSASGAIRFITKKPSSELEAGLNLTLGTHDNFVLKGRITGPILPKDALNASVSILRRQRRGWTYSVPLAQWVNKIDLWVARAKLESQLSSRLTATLSGDVMLDRGDASYYTPLNQPNGETNTGQETNPNLTWSNTIPQNETTVYGGSLTLEYDLTDALLLKSVTAVRGMHGPIYYDNDGTTYIKGDRYAGFDHLYETQEFTLNGDYEKLNFVGGIYLFNEYFHNDSLSQQAGSPQNNVGSAIHADSFLYTQSIGGFANGEYEFSDAFSVILGARYTLDHRRFDNNIHSQSNRDLIYPLPGNFDDPDRLDEIYAGQPECTPELVEQKVSCVTVAEVRAPAKNFSAFTPKAGVNFNPWEELLVYASYSRGFKSGGYDLRANNAAASLRPYGPQTIDAFELGWKSSLFGKRVTANVALYYNKIHDVQVRATRPGALGTPISSLINAGDAHTYGGELELFINPVRGLTLGTTLAYLETAYETFTATLPNNVAGRTTLVGLDFPLSPRWQANPSATVRIPLPGAGTWRLGVDVPIQSSYSPDIYNTPQTKVKAQTFVHGSLSYTSRDEFWSAGVAVNNLLNKQQLQTSTYVPSNAGEYPHVYGAYNPPRFINFFLNLGKI